jgi:hypothetical protein
MGFLLKKPRVDPSRAGKAFFPNKLQIAPRMVHIFLFWAKISVQNRAQIGNLAS